MRRNSHGGTDSGYSTHTFMKVPSFLLVSFGLILTVCVYFSVRLLIEILQRVFITPNMSRLKRMLHGAKSYTEWRTIAGSLNKESNHSFWRMSIISDGTLRKDLEDAVVQLRRSRKGGDCWEIGRVLIRYLNCPSTTRVLQVNYHRRSWIGTKRLIEMFISELVDSINTLADMVANDHESLTMAREVLYSNSFGRSALCLSGGGTMGLQHIGVLEALGESEVIPRIVSGTSAGSIVAAAYCVRTSAEVNRDFQKDFLYPRFQALWNSWSERLYKLVTKGYMFEQDLWREALGEFTLGDTTFIEAYNHTGKILNISTTARHTNVNFNYLTSPNVVIRSACIASCAMPTFFGNPVIYEKDPVTGDLKKVRIESYADGSLAGDVPALELRSLFGVRFVVTSQVNPHITPFMFFKRGEPGDPVCPPNTRKGGWILSTLEGYLKRQMQALLRVIDQSELELAGSFRLSNVYLQDFHGNVTIWNSNKYMKKLVQSLDKVKSISEYEWWVQEGRRMTWPKIRYIQSRILVEQAIIKLEQEVQKKSHDIKNTVRPSSIASST